MQAAHDETLAPTRKPPTKRKRPAVAEPDEDELGDLSSDAGLLPPLSADEDTPRLRALLAAEGSDPTYARYIVMAAKAQWLEAERSRLRAELEAAQEVEQAERKGRDAALDETMRRELGPGHAVNLAPVDPARYVGSVKVATDDAA